MPINKLETSTNRHHGEKNTLRPALNHRFCIAPMLDWTDRHARYFLRLISSKALLYTEMITTGALIHGDRERHLSFDPFEHPIAIQLGGSNPADLAFCAQLAEDWHYDEVNLNVGCPSNRVQSGRFGACLMAEPQTVADCVEAMIKAVNIPVTVKCRIGIDDLDSYAHLQHFIHCVADAGCSTFIVHARKAWLQGLSPKENRDIPPLHYDRVYQLKNDYPSLNIIINGGITSITECEQHLQQVDGVMLGRAAYHNPYLLNEVDHQLYGEAKIKRSRSDILLSYLPYVEAQLSQGIYLSQMSRHILGLFQEIPGAKKFRRHISENAHHPGANSDVLQTALNFVSESV